MDDNRETLKLCPGCGVYDVPRVGCKICGGRGLVSLRELEAYADRQATKRTASALKDLPASVRDALTGLEKRGTAQVRPMIIVGEALLARFEDEEPSATLYTSLSDWLAAVGPVLTRQR